jgi:predicted DNA-binding transcriptional regulator AlpA
MTESPFILRAELDAITRTSEQTRVRMEKRGLFPKRVSIGARKKARYRADVEAWLADPEGWAKRHAAGGGAR